MSEALKVLKQYWGYEQFRAVQEEVITAVLAGDDVLALLPTGGGKSVCFQVPAMIRDGICLVITPLIALMRDQVEQLNKRGIKATAIYSGMRQREIDIKLDNCVYGQVKFLYLSPERLKTDLFRERLVKMDIALLAVDEAHCISQWGYDFRPPYLEIAEVRQLIPEVNVIALTATATPQVRDDIQEKLAFREGRVFQKSFARANLSYAVRLVEDKEQKLLEVMKTVPGTAIVYVSTRRATKVLALLLSKNGISADYYHAGLSHEERMRKQDDWLHNRKRVIVATNAFGMGIDKPNVRLVVHMDLPADLESYYQEAGRAGRDERKAYALVIYQPTDLVDLERKVAQQYPAVEYLQHVYQCLANYYKLAVGSGLGQSFDFNIQIFADQYHLDSREGYHALKKLEEEGLIQFSESFFSPSQVSIIVNNQELYKFQIANAALDPIVKALLRTYGGELFGNFLRIAEHQLASFLHIAEGEVVRQLRKLDQLGIIIYDEKKDQPQVIFVQPRADANKLPINVKRLKAREQSARKKVEAMIHYVQHKHRCRTQLLLEYFGEVSYEACGVCDICIEARKQTDISHVHKYHSLVTKILAEGPLTVEEVVQKVNPRDKETLLEVMREMVDAGELKYDEKWALILT